MRLIALFGVLPLIWLVCYYAVYAESPFARRSAAAGLAAAILAALFSVVISAYFPRSRPFEHDPVFLMAGVSPGGSFPSVILAAAVAVATGIASGRRSPVLIVWIFLILVAAARVFCGIEYPFDAIGGAGIGLASAGLTRKAAQFVTVKEPISFRRHLIGAVTCLLMVFWFVIRTGGMSFKAPEQYEHPQIIVGAEEKRLITGSAPNVEENLQKALAAHPSFKRISNIQAGSNGHITVAGVKLNSSAAHHPLNKDETDNLTSSLAKVVFDNVPEVSQVHFWLVEDAFKTGRDDKHPLALYSRIYTRPATKPNKGNSE